MADTLLGIPPTSTGSEQKRRTMNIKECDNGYILRCDIFGTTQYSSTELVVTSLPQLLKKVKTFFEAEIEE